MICPRCKKERDRLLALSRKDNKTMICDQCGMEEALDDAGKLIDEETKNQIVDTAYGNSRKQSPYERVRTQVQATGNKWAMENFNATHG